MHVPDEDAFHLVADEPSIEDFEAPIEEDQRSGPRRAFFKVLRLLGTLLVIAALLVYFIPPLNSAIRSVPSLLMRPHRGIQRIPLVPEPKTRSPLHT